MSPLSSLIFGLGIFFLGLNLVGENLRGACGGGLRDAIAKFTTRPLPRTALGLLSGALMQSATAVTFICVSMVSAGLITSTAALGIILWCNTGLTALAFIATLDIHPFVALMVGGAGIILGVVRIRLWQTIAGTLIGIGLILLGLHQMGQGAAPLQQEEWFRHGIDAAVSSAPLAFLAGIAAAAILQSNTGATMMVITLAGAGAVNLQDAALMIYGTNLGAIALRMFLSSGMHGEGLRLVRFEDLFCIASGVLMLVLYFIESLGVPLVFAAVESMAGTVQTRLALVFLFSNLLPGLVLAAFLGKVPALLLRLFPAEAAGGPGVPRFLRPQALDDPATALLLLRKELARLPHVILEEKPSSPPSEDESHNNSEFFLLCNAIESFAIKLAARSMMAESRVAELHRLRTILSGMRHLEEAFRIFSARAASRPSDPTVRSTVEAVSAWMQLASESVDSLEEQKILQLREETRSHGEVLLRMQSALGTDNPANADLDQSALAEDLRMLAWALHRISKLLLRLRDPATP